MATTTPFITKLVTPIADGVPPPWILATGFWNDAGRWDDTDVWID